MEELLDEIGFAGAYHKPVQTFVGRGRVGADSVGGKVDTNVNFGLSLLGLFFFDLNILIRLAEDNLFSTQNVLQKSLLADRQRIYCKCFLSNIFIQIGSYISPILRISTFVVHLEGYCQHYDCLCLWVEFCHFDLF